MIKSKIIVLTVLLLCVAGMLSAQSWRFYSDASLSLAQSSYSDNWAGTELSSITWFGNSNSFAEKQLTKRIHNKTSLKLAFGQTHNQKTDSEGNKYWAKPDKTTDNIDLETLLKFTLDTFVDPYLSGRMESQFLDFSQQAIGNSRTLNPIRFTEAAGVSKTFIKKDNEGLSARLGAAFRQNMDRHSAVPLTVDEYENITTNDGGLEFITEYNKGIKVTNLLFTSRLSVFQSVFNSKSDELNDDWKAPDVVWDNVLSTKLFSMVTASLNVQLKYEKEEDKKFQYKETLGLGFSYQLF
jgi:hypothetical protein